MADATAFLFRPVLGSPRLPPLSPRLSPLCSPRPCLPCVRGGVTSVTSDGGVARQQTGPFLPGRGICVPPFAPRIYEGGGCATGADGGSKFCTFCHSLAAPASPLTAAAGAVLSKRPKVPKGRRGVPNPLGLLTATLWGKPCFPRRGAVPLLSGACHQRSPVGSADPCRPSASPPYKFHKSLSSRAQSRALTAVRPIAASRGSGSPRPPCGGHPPHKCGGLRGGKRAV